jgi:hypothetical protein
MINTVNLVYAYNVFRMQKITKVHMDTMGQTGAGISHQDQIDMSLDNELTTKWGMSCSST